MKQIAVIFITGILLSFPSLILNAQFYNGHQMTFGKNRVQYNDFFWNFYRFERFDTYFNQDGKELAVYTGKLVEKNLDQIENFFDYTLDKRVIFIIYNKLTDFRQSNIGLQTAKDEYNLGGQTQIVQNKVFLYFEGDFEKFDMQIRKAIAEVVLNEMIFGSGIGQNVANSTLTSYPEWFTEGLKSYVADPWNIDIENRVRDGIMTGRYEKINRLIGEDARIAGHSFWNFIAETYGVGVIPSIIYLSKYNKKVSEGFLNVLGMRLKEMSYDWFGYYYAYYNKTVEDQPQTDIKPLIKRPAKKKLYQNLKLDPTGKYLAYVSNDEGKYRVILLDKQSGKKTRLLKEGNRLEQIQDYSFPVMAWHPTGQILAIITEKQGGIKLFYYNTEDGELIERNLLYFDKVLDFSYSQDGRKLVLSAVRDGKSDIYVHSISSGTNEQITNDLADDQYPRFVSNSRQIIFASNRNSFDLKTEESSTENGINFNLFLYDYISKNDELKKIKNPDFSNASYPSEIQRFRYFALNDYNGIVNRYRVDFDSTVSFVDTTIHYRYFANQFPTTDYNRNILEYDFNPTTNEIAEVVFAKDRYYMYNYEVDPLQKIDEKSIHISDFRKRLIREKKEQDSLRTIRKQEIPIREIEDNVLVINNTDTLIIGNPWVDVNNYVFEKERINYYNEKYKDRNFKLVLDTLMEQNKKIRIYRPTFYPNYLASQVDFSFLNASYQVFDGSADFFTPGTNLFFKVGVNDLFEDYKVIGGIRLSTNLKATEYLLSFENLKYRTDRQYIFHRQSFNDEVYVDKIPYEVETQSNELYYLLKYPFNQVFAVRGSFNFRHNRTAFLTSSDKISSLSIPNENKFWAGAKGELIFDNTRSLGINLYSGVRYKVFAEAYKKLVKPYEDLYVFGADFRYYQVIHRNLIFASRFAISGSLGKARLIYFLGGVDNWKTIIPTNTPQFIPTSEIPINNEVNYAYKSVATNMRGFSQNIRNGSNFAVLNMEIRWPVFRYLINHPISNKLIDNFQTIGFFDVGSAWEGLTPYSGKNAYDNIIYPKEGAPQSYRITIDAQREPIVEGYGFGVRTQLFGYFMRFDWAWGIENKTILPRMFYFSLSLDF